MTASRHEPLIGLAPRRSRKPEAQRDCCAIAAIAVSMTFYVLEIWWVSTALWQP